MRRWRCYRPRASRSSQKTINVFQNRISVIREAFGEAGWCLNVSLRNPKTEQDGQDVQDGQDKEKKVVIVNDDDGLRKGMCKHQPTYPNALRQDKKSFSTLTCSFPVGPVGRLNASDFSKKNV